MNFKITKMINHEQKNETETQPLMPINIEWQAPEFEKYEKGKVWFVTAAIIALAVFTAALIMENFIFAFLIILAVFIIFIYALKEPRIVNFKIDSHGITIDKKLYTYQEIISFWIFYDPPHLKELTIKSKKFIAPLIKIPLADQDPVEIRQTLLKFIKEEKEEESLADIFARYLRF